MGVNEKLFDINRDAMNIEQSLSSKYESKIGISINAVNIATAMWALATTAAIDSISANFVFCVIYFVFSILLLGLMIITWRYAYSANKFTQQVDLPYGMGLNEYLRANSDSLDEQYRHYADELAKGVVAYKASNQVKSERVKKANLFGTLSLLLSILLTMASVLIKVAVTVESKASLGQGAPCCCHGRMIGADTPSTGK